MNEVSISVPGTTANLGPGYDALGIALDVRNKVTVREGASMAHPPIVADAADLFFTTSGKPPFPFSWEIEGGVPRSRGMGSSVTVRLGILHALNELTGQPLHADQLFELCARLEGHPDNAAPAAFGGFTVAKTGAPTLRCEVDPQLAFVLLIPDFEVATPAARAALPKTITHRDAAASCANACRVTAAFTLRRYELLAGCFEDWLHQPHRLHLIPMLHDVIAAGVESGAIGGFLSGSGSTICCVTLRDPQTVAAAMLAAAGSNARTLVTTADNRGTFRV